MSLYEILFLTPTEYPAASFRTPYNAPSENDGSETGPRLGKIIGRNEAQNGIRECDMRRGLKPLRQF
jgi:hypothetical protein